ncbi:MAG: hypothetical protein AAGJ81_14910 [Verrucomicrobiota bacterium]
MRSLLILLFIPIFAYAQEDSEKAVVQLSDQFMGLVKAEEYTKAFALLQPLWPIEESTYKNLVEQTNEQMGSVKNRFGAIVGTEYIRTEKVGDSLLRLIYLQKFEKSSLRWSITFYNPSGEWLVNSVSWDDKVGTLFE